MKDGKKPASDLVKVYDAQQMLEAQMIKALLEDGGVPAIVSDEALELLAFGLASVRSSTSYDVLVPAERVEDARAILERPRGPDWVCPECGEKIDGVFDACWKCGHERG